MIRWRLRPAMTAAKITNPTELARLTGLGYAICHRAANQAELKSIDVGTLETLAKALGCAKDPFALLERIP